MTKEKVIQLEDIYIETSQTEKQKQKEWEKKPRTKYPRLLDNYERKA